MHELAVTESILDIVKRHAEQAEAERVLRIYLVIGELSSIVDDSVQFYFDFLCQDTVAQGAELVFRRLAVEVACEACGHRWQPRRPIGPALNVEQPGAASLWAASFS